MKDLATAANLWEQGSRLESGKINRILFGRVQEDTSLEASLAYGARALCIASGGETAFDLLLGGAKDVVAVDVNPAQAFLVQLKALVYRRLPADEINGAFTSDARPAYDKLKPILPAELTRYFDAHRSDLQSGLIHSGQIDRDLKRAIGLFQKVAMPRRRIEQLIAAPTLEAQSALFSTQWGARRVDWALRLAFHPIVLKKIFGHRFGALAPKSLSAQVRKDLTDVLARSPLEDNPYVWQTFMGEYPPGGMPPWLTPFGHRRMAQVISRLGIEVADAADWMLGQSEPSLNLVCLSNILDAADQTQKQRVAEGIVRSVKSGGTIVLRSLFDQPIDLPQPAGGVLERVDLDGWVDRSLMCRKTEVYRWRVSR